MGISGQLGQTITAAVAVRMEAKGTNSIITLFETSGNNAIFYKTVPSAAAPPSPVVANEAAARAAGYDKIGAGLLNVIPLPAETRLIDVICAGSASPAAAQIAPGMPGGVALPTGGALAAHQVTQIAAEQGILAALDAVCATSPSVAIEQTVIGDTVIVAASGTKQTRLLKLVLEFDAAGTCIVKDSSGTALTGTFTGTAANWTLVIDGPGPLTAASEGMKITTTGTGCLAHGFAGYAQE